MPSHARMQWLRSGLVLHRSAGAHEQPLPARLDLIQPSASLEARLPRFAQGRRSSVTSLGCNVATALPTTKVTGRGHVVTKVVTRRQILYT